jgi:undecaprenyl-diphosphatase
VAIHADVAIFIAKIISVVFDTTSISILTLLMAIFLFIKKRKAMGLLLIVAVGGSVVSVAILKSLTAVARPANQLLFSSGFSYPSGHSVCVIVFIGLLTYFVWLNWCNSYRVKTMSLMFFVLMTAIVSFDRIYLNVHWLSDIVGGCLFGTFCLSFFIVLYERLKLVGVFETKWFNLVANVTFILSVVAVVSLGLIDFLGYLSL